ncbi:MAG TPA: LPS assembly lipoprotein LptE [Acetobacteraceae bacterium]|nr:LPS assembly lipoprotein LptE [Acetobacteraceae bacterium]
MPHRFAVALGSAALLAGCGFQPVYMPTASGKSGPAERNLAAVHVNLIPDRPGQELRQDLQERFGSDSGGSSRYNLSVTFSISGEGIGILPDTIATRIRLVANASWTLTTPEGARVTNGAARALDAFNVLDQQYFASDMDNDALQARLASAVADQITMQLAAYFRRRDAVASR